MKKLLEAGGAMDSSYFAHAIRGISMFSTLAVRDPLQPEAAVVKAPQPPTLSNAVEQARGRVAAAVLKTRGVREGGSGGSSRLPWRRTVNGVGL